MNSLEKQVISVESTEEQEDPAVFSVEAQQIELENRLEDGVSHLLKEEERLERIIEIKKGVGIDVSIEEAELVRLKVEEQNTNLRNGNEWIEENIPKLENEKLLEAGLEVFSDQDLSEADIGFLCETKAFWDANKNGLVKVVIANKDNWQETMRMLGRSEEKMKFTGKAKEYPIVPNGVSPFIVLPSMDVFTDETAYKDMYMQSPAFQEKSASPNGIEDLYRGIYLRNIVSHEMSHLYQASRKDIEAVSAGDSSRWDNFMETREYLACAFGLWNLKKSGEQGFSEYLDACRKAVEGNEGVKYAIEQAQRSLWANNFLDSYSDEELDNVFRELYTACRNDDDNKRAALNKKILALEGGEIHVVSSKLEGSNDS